MLIEKQDDSVIIRFNNLFYGINAIISANTKFAEEFSTEVSFTVTTAGGMDYHLVKLKPKKNFNLTKVYSYVNEVLKQQELWNKNQEVSDENSLSPK